MDYNNEYAVKGQIAQLKNEILKYKDHPALLVWGIGNEVDLRYSNFKVWETIEILAKFIKDNRSKMKFRLQQNKSIFYTDKKFANQLVSTFWEDWVGSTVVDPKYANLKENTIGCMRLPNGKYKYQIHLKKSRGLRSKLRRKRQKLRK